MLRELIDSNFIMIVGVIVAFAATYILHACLKDKLPHDQGRAFAVDGEKSKGKARGSGIIFVLVFVACDLIFNRLNVERCIYLSVITFSMVTGYLDDASERPWNEYLKGALDLVLAIITAVTYLEYNGNTFVIGFLGSREVTLPYIVYGILIVALVWMAINVTNCSDGVDGLSGTLTIITLGSFYLLIEEVSGIGSFEYSIMLFMVVLAAYLWFNATPSTILMGDAGSRAMGVMIAITALMSHSPLLYIPLSIVLILDGGLGLLKVALLRFLKIRILKNTRCPLHDQARKVKGWSNTQVVMRFATIQIIVSLITVWAYWMLY